MSTGNRERARKVGAIPERWPACFKKEGAVAAYGRPPGFRAMWTVCEDMTYSVWAWGLVIEFDPARRELTIEESVDTE